MYNRFADRLNRTGLRLRYTALSTACAVLVQATPTALKAESTLTHSTPHIGIHGGANAHLAAFDPTQSTVPDNIRMTIETYMSGFHLATSIIEMKRENGRYTMSTQTDTQGIMDTFVRAKFKTASSGAWGKTGIRPERYTSEGQTNWGTFASEIRYDGLKPEVVKLDAEAEDPDEKDEWLEVPEHMTVGTLDPLTASLTGTLLANAADGTPCASRVAVYNGWSRMDFFLTDQGHDTLNPDRERFYAGPAQRCQLEVERLAGGRKKDISEEKEEPTPPGILWVADFSGYTVPVRFQLSSKIGHLVAHLVDVTVDGNKLALADLSTTASLE